MAKFEMEHLGGAQKVAHEETKQQKKNKVAAKLLGNDVGGAALAANKDNTARQLPAGEGKGVEPLHDLAGLSCADHGGPSDASMAVGEMVYWKDIPSDAAFKSPIWNNHGGSGKRKYLTFEPDGK